MAKKKMDWKLLALTAVVSATAVLGAVAVFGRDTDAPKTETLNTFDYGIYMLHDEDGAKMYSSAGLTTKNFYALKDVENVTVENEDCVYYVNFYDKDEEFLGVTEGLTVDYKDAEIQIPEGAEFVKFEIVNTKDDSITIWEKGKLAKGVVITITEKTEVEVETEEGEAA